jgi:hypothetical protein
VILLNHNLLGLFCEFSAVVKGRRTIRRFKRPSEEADLRRDVPPGWPAENLQPLRYIVIREPGPSQFLENGMGRWSNPAGIRTGKKRPILLRLPGRAKQNILHADAERRFRICDAAFNRHRLLIGALSGKTSFDSGCRKHQA